MNPISIFLTIACVAVGVALAGLGRPWLAPDITAAIVNGRHPQQLNAKVLMRQASRLPADWAEQRTQFGFRNSSVL
jgi:hypothetical protein